MSKDSRKKCVKKKKPLHGGKGNKGLESLRKPSGIGFERTFSMKNGFGGKLVPRPMARGRGYKGLPVHTGTSYSLRRLHQAIARTERAKRVA